MLDIGIPVWCSDDEGKCNKTEYCKPTGRGTEKFLLEPI